MEHVLDPFQSVNANINASPDARSEQGLTASSLG